MVEKMVPITPKIKPPFLKANGIARIPVPSAPFMKWISVSVELFWEN